MVRIWEPDGKLCFNKKGGQLQVQHSNDKQVCGKPHPPTTIQLSQPATPPLHDIFHGKELEASQLSTAFPTAVYLNKQNECFLNIYAMCMSATIQSAGGLWESRIKWHFRCQSTHKSAFTSQLQGRKFHHCILT